MYVQAKSRDNWYCLENSPGHYLYRIGQYTFEKDSTHQHDTKPAEEWQIAHLKACIAANKYIPYTENMLTPQYEIF